MIIINREMEKEEGNLHRKTSYVLERIAGNHEDDAAEWEQQKWNDFVARRGTWLVGLFSLNSISDSAKFFSYEEEKIKRNSRLFIFTWTPTNGSRVIQNVIIPPFSFSFWKGKIKKKIFLFSIWKRGVGKWWKIEVSTIVGTKKKNAREKWCSFKNLRQNLFDLWPGIHHSSIDVAGRI